MTAGTTQPKKSAQRRIIERPRLMALLDESDAKTVLLTAAAGYGKSTLARQWARTLQRQLWLTLNAAHRDVSVLGTELAREIDALGGEAHDFVQRYVLSRANPQRVAREIARVVAEHIDAAGIHWIILDDYHEVAASPEAEVFVETLQAHVSSRLLIASRNTPSWATQRLQIYGEVLEIGRETLAMDADESSRLLGRRRGLDQLVAQAEGWPAVLGLAASAGARRTPTHDTVPSSLYQFFADELYQSTPATLRDDLMRLALAPDLSEASLASVLHGRQDVVVGDLRERGFLSAVGTEVELHPLVREFLLEKLAADHGRSELVRPAIALCVERGKWIRAFDLILRFGIDDLTERTLELAYVPLIRTGRLGTLSSFAESVRLASDWPPAVAELVEAEVALRDGKFERAREVAERVATRLQESHPLQARTHSILGQCSFVQGRLEEAERSYRAAFESSASEGEQAEALRGWALASVQCEAPDSSWALSQLSQRRHRSPSDLLRYRTAEINRRRFDEGFRDPMSFEEELNLLKYIADPRAISGFTATAAYVNAVRADYPEAASMMRITDELIDEYDLDFARPYAIWNNAFIALGLRQFGLADRLIQDLEDLTVKRPVGFHLLNARLLRARLCLQTGQLSQAVDAVAAEPRERAIPSVPAEYIATRAIALALERRRVEALEDACRAEEMSRAVEVRTLAQTARAIDSVMAGESTQIEAAWQLAETLGAWDALLTGLRACPELGEAFASANPIRSKLGALYARTNDLGLARKAGLRVRTAGRADQLLSPRELEVLELLSRGFRNRDIADALVVSPSTIKVHIRHIHEKLGVRTRTEAVARLRGLAEPS